MTFHLWIVLLIGFSVCFSESKYSFKLRRLNDFIPVISSRYPSFAFGSSVFDYNYNAAFVPLFDTNGKQKKSGALLVRCQNYTRDNIYEVGPSMIAFTPMISDSRNVFPNKFKSITVDDIVMMPESPDSDFGVEDPRVVYDTSSGIYYVFFTSFSSRGPKLSFMTTKNPSDSKSYINYGPIFPDISSSKSGALLIREKQPSYLIWGDSSLVNGIQMAVTMDLLNYTNLPGIFLPIRKDHFDSVLVEAGPMPLRLSDGNYLFLYNSARNGYPSKKPQWDLQYNVGWVILNGTDPTEILERCEEPILSPELPWEVGSGEKSLTPNVVFLEGWVRTEEASDSFFLFYGAADTVVGLASLTVSMT